MIDQPLVLAAALLLLGGVLASKTSARLGVPSLLLFLALGMLAGSEGVVGIEFDDAEVAQQVGVVALAFILFAGGLGTRWRHIRPALAPGVALATIGVVISAGVLGVGATLVLDLDLQEGLLLGAIIASTDAAAVFSILRSRGVAVSEPLQPMLELESGSNDPTAVFLTVGILGIITGDGPGVGGLALDFVVQMGVGTIAGFLLARAAAWLINRVRLDFDGLYPVLTVAFVLLTFEGTNAVGGSGFLAAYVAGLVLAEQPFLHKRSLIRFHDALAWLAQIAMFVLFGLLVFPSDLPEVALGALGVAAVLILVARPLAVAATLAPFRVPWRHVGFVSWVGLRGATPIILATFPVVEGIDGATTIFDTVFFVVLTSVLLQGTTIPLAARLLEVDGGRRDDDRSYAFDAVMTGDAGVELRPVDVARGSPAVDRPVVALGLPDRVLIVLVQRGDDLVVPEGRTVVRAGDRLLVLADDADLAAARAVLAPRPVDPPTS